MNVDSPWHMFLEQHMNSSVVAGHHGRTVKMTDNETNLNIYLLILLENNSPIKTQTDARLQWNI